MTVATNSAGVRPRVGVLSSAVAAAIASLSSASYVHAQEQQAQPQLEEEITVTGSRIQRRDFTANSPIQTVDQEMFEETSAVGVETVLNRLPQFVPAVTQFTTGDVQQTVTNTVGASTVSLRGLGPNRNLVLINGRRAMPVDPRRTRYPVREGAGELLAFGAVRDRDENDELVATEATDRGTVGS